jgi:Arc/MetJ-type ribon-helix-helix transcriptional regulator
MSLSGSTPDTFVAAIRACPEAKPKAAQRVFAHIGARSRFATMVAAKETILMALQISPEIQARIAEMVERGSYADADEILGEALDQLELANLRRLLAEGAADVEAGRVVEYTPALMEEIKREALRRFDAGERAGPDVRP